MSKYDDAYWDVKITQVGTQIRADTKVIVAEAVVKLRAEAKAEAIKLRAEVKAAGAKAAEDAVGFHSESLKHDIGLVLEATDFIKEQLDNVVTKDEFNDLNNHVKTMTHALKATNKDVREHGKRITKLEATVGNA